MEFKTAPRNVCEKCWENISLTISSYLSKFYDICSCTKLLNFEYKGRCPFSTVERLLELFGRPKVSDNVEILTCIHQILEHDDHAYLLQILDAAGLAIVADGFCFGQTIQPDTHVYSLPVVDSFHLQEYYYQLKNGLDNTNLDRRTELLTRMKRKNMTRINNSSNPRQQLYYANRHAVTTWVRMQHCKRNTTNMKGLLNKMVKTWPKGVDRILADIFVQSKLGVVNAMRGDVAAAILHMDRCYIIVNSFNINDPLVRAFVCHDRRYTNQLISSKDTPLSERAQSVLTMSMEGARYMTSDQGDSNFCTLMKRIFWLYIAQHYLNIGNDLKVEEVITSFSLQHLPAAKATLWCFHDSLLWGPDAEERRKMVFNVCKARVYEMEGKFENAIDCLSEALATSASGAHFPKERENIVHYMDRLVQNTNFPSQTMEMLRDLRFLL